MSSPAAADSYHCGICGQEFSDIHVYRGHFTKEDHEPPWRDKNTLRRLYHGDNLSVNEIAKKFDCGHSTISKWMDRHDIERNPSQKLSDKVPSSFSSTPEELTQKDWLRQKYREENKTFKEISEALDVGESTVRDWVEKLGIEKRSSEERYRLQTKKQIERKTPDELLSEQWLREHYVEEDLSGTQVADKLDCTCVTVYKWLKRHDIEIGTESQPCGADHWAHKGYDGEYGEGWNQPKRKEVRERDDYECQICGLSQEEHRQKNGCKLHVHHIIPIRQFESGKKRANEPPNLITVCAQCHSRWEGVPLKPDRRGFD